MRTGLILIGVLHLGGLASLPAQQRAAPFTRWEPSATAPDSARSRAAEVKWGALGDYRYEGLALGGVVLGAFGVWVGSQISAGCLLEPAVPCHTDKAGQAVALGLAGAAIGGGIGYLVGRFSPKKPPRIGTELPSEDLVSVPDSVRIRTGYQHWRGGALGLAVGGALGALTGATVGNGRCDDCSQQTSRGGAALRVGLVGAGAGGLLGFLVGLTSPRYAWIPRGPQ